MPYSYTRAFAPSPGVFDRLADHCILLAMPGRLARASRRLREDRPHSRVTVQLNPGPGGKAGLVERTTRADICHAFAAAFEHALARGWSRLLVLEDDFFLGDAGDLEGARAASGEIAEFLEGREFDTYNLGRAVFSGWPAGKGTWRALAHATAHGVVYSERYMRAYAAQHASDPRPIVRVGNDVWWNRAGMVHYVYERPLVFQLFPRTANREMWDGPLRGLGISLLRLDRRHQPGYSVLSALSKASLPAAASLALAPAALALWAIFFPAAQR